MSTDKTEKEQKETNLAVGLIEFEGTLHLVSHAHTRHIRQTFRLKALGLERVSVCNPRGWGIGRKQLGLQFILDPNAHTMIDYRVSTPI